MDIRLARYWEIAAESGFARPADWTAWADEKIAAEAKPPLWVIDMAVAKSPQELLPVLRRHIAKVTWTDPSINGTSVDPRDAFLGYLFFRSEVGELPFAEMLRLAASWCDGGGYHLKTPGISLFYQLRDDWLTAESEDEREEVVMRAREIVAPHRQMALDQWSVLIGRMPLLQSEAACEKE